MQFSVAHIFGSFPNTTFITNTLNVLNRIDNQRHIVFAQKANKSDLTILSTVIYSYSWYSIIAILFILIKSPQKILTLVKVACSFREFLLFLNILKYNPKIIHIHWIKDFSQVWKFKNKLNAGFKIVVSVRGYQLAVSPILSNRYRNLIEKAILESDLVHSISNDLTTIVKSIVKGKKQTEICKVIPVVDSKIFNYRHRDFEQDRLKILIVGNLVWKKGIHYALHSIKVCVESGLDLAVTICGDGKQFEELLFLTKALRINDFVTFEGQCSRNKILNELYSAHVLLHPSVQEGFGNAVAEAQSTGLPCLVSDAEGLSENVSHLKTGYVFKKRSISEITNAIFWFSNLDISSKIKLGQSGSKLIKDRNNESIHMQKFKELYNSLN